MAKRIKAGALDESLIIQSFKDDSLLSDPSSAVRSEPVARVPPSEPNTTSSVPQKESDESDDDNVPVKGKPRRRRNSYEDTFLNVKACRARQTVYISQATHQAISKLEEGGALVTDLKNVVTSGNGLSMSDKERMDVVDQIYYRMLEYRNLTRYFTNKTISVSYLRSRAKGDSSRVLALYGSPSERYW